MGIITKRKVNSLKIIYWNANGIRNKLNELQEHIHRDDFDLILLGNAFT